MLHPIHESIICTYVFLGHGDLMEPIPALVGQDAGLYSEKVSRCIAGNANAALNIVMI